MRSSPSGRDFRWMAARQHCRAKVDRGSMQTKGYGSGDEPNQSHGLRGVEHREVKARTDGNRIGNEERKIVRRSIERSDSNVGCGCRSLAQDGGGQGVLSRLEGEGLRADRARGSGDTGRSNRK